MEEEHDDLREMRRACRGGGQRNVVEVIRPAEVHEAQGGEEGGKEGGEVGGEEKGGTEQVVRKARASALKPVYDEIKITFENWRMGGHYVDSEDLMGEFGKVCERRKSEFTGLQSGGKLSRRDDKCMLAIETRLEH